MAEIVAALSVLYVVGILVGRAYGLRIARRPFQMWSLLLGAKPTAVDDD